MNIDELWNKYATLYKNILLNGDTLMTKKSFTEAIGEIISLPVEPEVSKKFAETIKNAIEQLTFMKLLLNHQGESASKKEINNCLGCKREKKINEIIEQLSKFSC